MLVLDLETVKTDDESLINYKVADKKREDYKKKAIDKMALFPTTGKIILCGMLSDIAYENYQWIEREHNSTKIYELMMGLNGETEKDIIEAAWKIIYSDLDRGGRIITYNGKSFDIPYLIRRAIVLDIASPHRVNPSFSYYPFDLISKYKDADHIDLFQKLNPNYGEYSGLGEWTYVTGISNMLSSDGNKVGEWYNNREYDKIIEHCREDIWKTFLLYERVKKWVN